MTNLVLALQSRAATTAIRVLWQFNKRTLQMLMEMECLHTWTIADGFSTHYNKIATQMAWEMPAKWSMMVPQSLGQCDGLRVLAGMGTGTKFRLNGARGLAPFSQLATPPNDTL
jgi:hypothetical protein